MAVRCPGQDQRYWKPEDLFLVGCPHCGDEIEFCKDEPVRRCSRCGGDVRNPRIDLGCAAWCKHAAECLGKLPNAAAAPLRDRLLAAMDRLFGEDSRRKAHARAVLAHAEAIRQAEGGDPTIVTAAAILHDIGIHEAERKHGSAAGNLQELEGPPIARRILEAEGVEPATIAAICGIIANHHSAADAAVAATPEFRALWDADWLVNLPEEFPGDTPAERAARIEKVFRTGAGKARAKQG